MFRSFRDDFRQALDFLKNFSKEVDAMSACSSRSGRSRGLALFVCCLTLAMTVPARADLMDINEIMMGAEQCDAVFLAGNFGTDANSTLSFTSNVDSIANTFSYTSAPGSTYLGQSFALTSSGSYDATDGIWNWSSTGSLGATSWTLTGTQSITGDPNDTIAGFIQRLGFKYNLVIKFPGDGTSLGTGTYSFDGFTYLTVHEKDVESPYGFGPDNWKVISSQFFISMNAPVAPLNGPGNFNLVFNNNPAAVPEPASCVLVGCGLAGGLALGRLKRARAALGL